MTIQVARDREQFAVVFPPARAAAAQAGGQVEGAAAAVETQAAEGGGTGEAAPAEGTGVQVDAVVEAPTMGILILNTQPPGARITIDGELRPQMTPFAESLAAGEHRVLLSLEGYKPAELTVSVESGGQAKTDLSLAEAWAELAFDVRPTAKISLDGAHILDTPYAKGYPVRAGRHVLTIENEALGVKKTVTVELAEGERKLIQEVLK
jgi:serine/threonine-protein kinase